MAKYRIEHRYPCYPGGGCIPYDVYFVQVLQKGFFTDKWNIRREKTLVDDLGADSIDFVEIVMELEKAFGITIKDDEAEHLNEWTVGDLYKYVEGKL